MFFNTKKKKINRLLELAIQLGLQDIDSDNAIEFLNIREYGLAFDTIVCQLYEYDNEISQSFYDEVKKTAKCLNVEKSNYDFLKKNIRKPQSIPIAVQDKIGEIISDVKNRKEK